MAAAMNKTAECPLCHEKGKLEKEFQGSYDVDTSHLTFIRRLYRCPDPNCGAVFFYDELLRQEEDPQWEDERNQEIKDAESRIQELQKSEAYHMMVRAREENDPLVTKDRELMKQVKEMEGILAKEREDLESFPQRMRNFRWDQPEEVNEWVEARWLPPIFAEKGLNSHFGMSRPAIRKDIPDEELALWREDNPTYKEGQTVVHQTWGKGKVVEGNSEGGTIITAKFPKKGTKKMDLRYAKLEKA